MLSIIIPTLNADVSLAATLEACKAIESETIVSDGGSTDQTCEIAQSMGAKLISSKPNRGLQLRHGAENSNGDWLLFLHADCIPAQNWGTCVEDFINTKTNRYRAGVFQLKLDDTTRQARRIEWWTGCRTRLLALPYGDQGLLISRAYYNGLGAYRPIPLMEDVDIIRKIGRSGLCILPTHITTSAKRYQQDGYWKRPMRNLGLLSLYYLGVPPKFLARLYQ
ncbi:MAG: glycosyltransferase [Rhodospirillales bacterium]|jgi:rSAM/selenodomain-associated transferase 2|nr:glycosyltransferase [Rhodospirillales bacterium]